MNSEYGVLEIFRHSKDQLTQTERLIADYVLDNPRKIPTMTIHQLADETETSPAAVSRLCRKIGCESFQSFKVNLSSELGSHRLENPTDIFNQNNPDDYQQFLLSSIKNVVQDTLSLSDLDLIQAVADTMRNASVIFVFGVGLSRLAADNIFQKWTRAGKTVLLIQEQGMGEMMMSKLSNNAIFIGISNSGKSLQVQALMKQANNLNMPTILMTRRAPSVLAQMADQKLYTAPVTDEPSALSTSIYAQSSLIDLLFSIYVKDLDNRNTILTSF